MQLTKYKELKLDKSNMEIVPKDVPLVIKNPKGIIVKNALVLKFDKKGFEFAMNVKRFKLKGLATYVVLKPNNKSLASKLLKSNKLKLLKPPMKTAMNLR